jgi:hypothetical protein
MITDNINDNSSRHLMLITPDIEENEAISFVENIINTRQREYRIF